MKAQSKLGNLPRVELISVASSLDYYIERLNDDASEAYLNAQIHGMEEDRAFFRQKAERVAEEEKELEELRKQIPKIEYSLREQMEEARCIPWEELIEYFETDSISDN